MADIEKVIKGLEYCIADEYCDECPYTDDCFEIDDKPYGEQLMRDALSLLKEQEAVTPKYIDGKRNHFIKCGKCNTDLMRGMKYCPYCGKAVKWE